MAYTKEQQKENRAKWVKALRSGKYKQGEGVLFDKKTKAYCCLGVLCNVAGIKPVTSKTAKGVSLFDGAENTAPQTAMDFVGLSTEGGAFDDLEQKYYKDITNALWKLNDEHRFTFKQIADVIESEPKGLFK